MNPIVAAFEFPANSSNYFLFYYYWDDHFYLNKKLKFYFEYFRCHILYYDQLADHRNYITSLGVNEIFTQKNKAFSLVVLSIDKKEMIIDVI